LYFLVKLIKKVLIVHLNLFQIRIIYHQTLLQLNVIHHILYFILLYHQKMQFSLELNMI